MPIYKGFSTYNRLKKFRVVDNELIKQNLFNHFHIRKGEKLMRPDFGTIIWGVLFDPLTPDTKAAIIDDITRIVNSDPRVAVKNVLVSQFDHGLQVEIELRYVTTNQVESMRLQFDRESNKIAVV